jgi:hypothetical protein
MTKSHLWLVVTLLAFHWGLSQTKTIETEHWVDRPTVFKVQDPYTRESAVIVLDKRRFEYIDNDKKEVEEYYTFHRIIHLNDDRAIEMFNKIYLGFGENSEVLDVKARAILPDGKIMELDKSNIKDLKEQDGKTYKIFALEGMQDGCDIEYFYTMKIDPSYFGREVFQSKNPVLESRTEIIAPERLRFEFKGYNCTATVTDTVLDNKRRFVCEFKNIPGVEEEKYASYDANLMRLEFKLSYNSSVKDERLFTWNELARKMYAIYSDVSADDQKKAAELVKKEGWEKLPDETSKIMAAENFLKINLAYDESNNGEESGKIAKILQTRRAGTVGIMRIYGAAMTGNLRTGTTASILYYISLPNKNTWRPPDRIFDTPSSHHPGARPMVYSVRVLPSANFRLQSLKSNGLTSRTIAGPIARSSRKLCLIRILIP